MIVKLQHNAAYTRCAVCNDFDEQNELTVNHQIPSGGTLLDQEQRFIAYDAPH